MVYGDIFLRLCISENDFVLTSHFITGFPGYNVAGGKLFVFKIVRTLLHWASRSLKPFGLLEYLYMTSSPLPSFWKFLESSLCPWDSGQVPRHLTVRGTSSFLHLFLASCHHLISSIVYTSSDSH